MSNIFALDIGGAFIKTTFLKESGEKQFSIVPFELFKHPESLSKELKKLKLKIETKKFQTCITMTGELCDSFPTRAYGVQHIVNSSLEVFGEKLKIFSRKGKLLEPLEAIKFHEDVASANWLLPPLHLSQKINDFLFVDIGSTTTDLTPVQDGVVSNKGWDDFGRLANEELLYAGYLRTPIQSVKQKLTVKGLEVSLVSETFATMGDVYLTLGKIDAVDYLCATPDGKGKNRNSALTRIARCVLSEKKKLGISEVINMAEELALAMRQRIKDAIAVFGLPVIVTGKGAFILDEAIADGEIEIAKHDVDEIENLDPSHALAMLLLRG